MKNKKNPYLQKIKREKISIIIWQILILIVFMLGWELSVRFNLINGFIFSSPTRIMNTITGLYESNMLFIHIGTTLFATIIGFILAFVIGFLVSMLMWWFPKFSKVINPYLTILNSLPKVALGPIFIIWVGAGMNSIIVMALCISVIISIINISIGFQNTDPDKIKLLQAFKATKWQKFTSVVVPSNYHILIETLKINISMSLIGVIMGELLVSRHGIGWMIMYGSQVFNLDLVMTGIVILGIISTVLYMLVTYVEKKALKHLY